MADAPIRVLTLEETERRLAERVRVLRLFAGWKQATLAERSGVTLASLRRFEGTGKASLTNLMRLVHALGRLDEFDELLKPPAARSLAELEARTSRPLPKRGRR
jgi:transcriptional regulator with XRE-family HTH domain